MDRGDIPDSGWRRQWYMVIFEAETPGGRRFDVVLMWAIIISVFCVLLDSDQQIGADYEVTLRYLEWFFTFLFSIEYIFRIICVKKPLSYIFSFYGIVDFLSIVPTYLGIFFDSSKYLAVVRAIRLLRVFRVLKLARYSKASNALLTALNASRAKITVFLGAVLTIVLLVGTLMHIIEQGNPGFSSIFKGMYWTIVTMTTVGYGDVVPVTTLGKFIASVIMILGYGIIAVPTGIVTSELSNISDFTNKLRCTQCFSLDHHKTAKFCHGCGAELSDKK